MNSAQNTDASGTKWPVFLPNTSFPMRGDLPHKEPEILLFWERHQIKERLKQKRDGSPKFVLTDGPPYANGAIHIGHALNKILKDFIAKYKALRGFQVVFRPGWDCHGLPIEQTVTKKLGDQAQKLTAQEIREFCRKEAAQWIGVQKEQFQRLGVFGDWEKPYITMDPGFEAEEIRVFAEAFKKGVVYRGMKPIYWNWALQTALAEAEVEYHIKKSPSIYLEFPIVDETLKRQLGLSPDQNVAFLVWTTTPWTLPANVALALNEQFTYGLFWDARRKCYLIMSAQTRPGVERDTQLTFEEKASFPGSQFAQWKVQHPFIDREVLVIFGDHVTQDMGTGVVHTAPGHGPDDYLMAKKYGLPILSPVGPDGVYTSEAGEFAGVHIKKADALIIEKLQSLGRLLWVGEIEHSYPHCWRTKIPLIFRATTQWFLGLDLPETCIRQKALKAIEQLHFYPEWGRSRFQAMIENRPDWCLSRQRIWGVPIPVYVCKKTGEILADYHIMLKIADLVERHPKGIEAYYETDPQEVIGAFVPQGDFGREGFAHGGDILDVWFDSGVVHAAVQKKTKGMDAVADVYVEGSDQHRGWFNTSLLTALVTDGRPPYRSLLTHGFIQQSKGVKMSKSKGGGADPVHFASTKGADILRLWCAHEELGKDVIWGEDLIERVTETYRRLRNTFRFLLGALADFQAKKHLLPYGQLTRLDQWALHRLNELNQEVIEAYDQYAFHKVYHAVNEYVTVDLSSFYLDILKDRLYTYRLDHPDRRSAQTALYYILDVLNSLVAPILSFLSEEVYSHREKVDHPDSIFLVDFPTPRSEWKRMDLAREIDVILGWRSTIQKELELLRAQKIIGSSLEARVLLQVSEDYRSLIENWQQLREIFIVSDLQVSFGNFAVKVSRHSGNKCPRCWIYYDRLESPNNICAKCVEAVT
ncbi:MAG: isoleucine--tRNA ligase [Bdellovibrionaceae bacterium]|nr:isoleucine--tRNA ligase [Pseudobdellovibrionaceae bacterium]MDW8189658.1 isoleucine--tRNA ligase [Pseudobdellovibrionaceae bacterium]